MQDLGFDNVYDFFDKCEVVSQERDMDMCLSSLCGVVELARKENKIVTKEYLRNFGKNIVYYDGVLQWFDKINAIGREYGYEIEHYVISSGIREIIEGSSISKYFKRIYRNKFQNLR